MQVTGNLTQTSLNFKQPDTDIENCRSSHCGAAEINLTRNREFAGSIRGLSQWVKYGSSIAVSCGVGRRRGSDLASLWLWYRPAAVAPVQPLAWKPPCATSAALKRQKTKKKTKKKKIPEVRQASDVD